MANGETRIVQLNGENILVKETGSGLIRATQRKVKLDSARQHWYFRSAPDTNDRSGGKKKYIDRKVITASGLEYINTFTGISFIQPDTLLNDDGRTVGNPYCEWEHGAIKAIRTRVIGIGRNSSGNLTAFDLTFVYSFITYLAADLYAKWYSPGYGEKKTPTTQKWGKLSSSPVASDDGWKNLPVTAGVYLSINLNDPALLGIWSKALEEQKFASRRALSMARRNVLKSMLGLAYCEDDETVKVTVWQEPDRDLNAIVAMVQKHREGELIVDGEKVSVVSTTKVADDEDFESSHDEDQDRGDEPIHPTPDVVPAKLVELRNEARALVGKHGAKSPLVAEALQKAGVAAMADLAKCPDALTFEKFIAALK